MIDNFNKKRLGVWDVGSHPEIRLIHGHERGKGSEDWWSTRQAVEGLRAQSSAEMLRCHARKTLLAVKGITMIIRKAPRGLKYMGTDSSRSSR